MLTKFKRNNKGAPDPERKKSKVDHVLTLEEYSYCSTYTARLERYCLHDSVKVCQKANLERPILEASLQRLSRQRREKRLVNIGEGI